VRQVHEGPRCDLQDENGSARYVDELSVHSRLSVRLPVRDAIDITESVDGGYRVWIRYL
jgi:hypothetical protein